MSGHYKQGNIECIDAIKASMTPEEFRGFCKGNVMKYLWRYQHKGGINDIEKAFDYLRWLYVDLRMEEDNDKGDNHTGH